jgi:hypothetical protein
MKETKTTCDRCDATADEDASWWQLAFTREVVLEDLTEYISETWDLCETCYAVVAPSVVSLMQTSEDED